MVQKVSCSDSSSQNSLSPRGDWLETRGEALRPPTAVFLDDVGAPVRGSTRRPRCWFSTGRSSFGGCRRAPTATSRLRPGPWGSCVWWCITPGQDVLDRLSLLLHCWELPGRALDSVAEQPSLGDGSVEKACFVDVLHLCQVEPEMALLDHQTSPFTGGWSQSPNAAPASTLGRNYPRAFVSVPWLGEPAG